MWRGERAIGESDAAILVFQIRKVEAALLGPPRHLRQGVGRREERVVRVDGDELHAALAVRLLQADQPPLVRLDGGAASAGEDQHKHRLVVERAEGVAPAIHAGQFFEGRRLVTEREHGNHYPPPNSRPKKPDLLAPFGNLSGNCLMMPLESVSATVLISVKMSSNAVTSSSHLPVRRATASSLVSLRCRASRSTTSCLGQFGLAELSNPAISLALLVHFASSCWNFGLSPALAALSRSTAIMMCCLSRSASAVPACWP